MLSDFPTGTSIKENLSVCAYRLLQGELWAQYYSHNGRPVAGYKPVFLNNRPGFIGPDGTTFLERDKSTLLGDAVDVKVQDGTAKSADMSLNSKHNLFVGTMRNILTARADATAVGPYKTTFTHNKFHTSLNITGKSAEVCEDILSPTVSILDKITNNLYTINNIIAMPQFLNDNIKARLNGDYSEGNVYYRVKEYVEEKHPGVSIDRTAETHQYILVSTNCFDDLVKPSLASKLNSKEATLQQKYEGRVVKLSTFYRMSELDKLGIPDINVVMDPAVKTQAVFDKEHRQGEIHIQTTVMPMSDEVLLDKLNHEFRHVLQKYNKFELGFTRDFKVSDAMLADV